LIFDKVTDKNKLAPFYDSQYRVQLFLDALLTSVM